MVEVLGWQGVARLDPSFVRASVRGVRADGPESGSATASALNDGFGRGGEFGFFKHPDVAFAGYVLDHGWVSSVGVAVVVVVVGAGSE